MCGIVGYFGDAENNLTRLLTGMSAIIYRAPDSTGIGFFGDDTEPLRARRTIGSVAKLSETLLTEAVYPNQAKKLMALWNQAETADPSEFSRNFQESQRRLLTFEGFSPDIYEPLDDSSYPVYDDLIVSHGAEPVRLVPGHPGSPEPPPVFSIRSRKDLVRIIHDLTCRYDLSFIVIQTLIRNALSETLAKEAEKGDLEITPSDILNAFDQLFEKVFLNERKPKPVRLNYEWFQRNPYAQRYLWRHLRETRIRIPQDYDRDGVRCVFRLLDAALLCRLPVRPEIHEMIQEIMERVWPGAKQNPDTDWKTLYWAEKGANVYGWAAASVLTWLQREELLPELFKDVSNAQLMSAEFIIPGHTDPVCLRFFTSPAISQGRWAIQAPVTLKNAHPFFDANKHRLVALNGQFNGEVEANVHDFLADIAKLPFRSENSTEYFSLLWGYYFEHLSGEIRRYKSVISSQNNEDLDAYTIGSQTIDYQVWRRIREKSPVQLDELAFLEATRRMKMHGGQIAVSGISLCSPRRIYVACHNRPAFIVQRTDTDDFMIVSDINAGMGLFPQSLIHEKILELNQLRKCHAETMTNLREAGADKRTAEAYKRQHGAEENAILKQSFSVRVFHLEGEEIFARIETGFSSGALCRDMTITDFDGNPMPDIEPFQTVLTPVQVRKNLYGSFYETHLHEIPDRLGDILQFHIPDEETLPRFNIRERFLRRRFGPGFASLKRIVVAGMGSSYNVGLMARRFFHELMPETDVLVIRPADLDDISKLIVPEKDFVILLSWSGTTADMVEFAKELRTNGIAMVGITEKVFADMSLITSKSGGVIPVLSGEEVTVSGIKSVVCLLFCLDLLGLWLSSRVREGRKPGFSSDAPTYDEPETGFLEKLRDVPGLISQVIEDKAVENFSDDLASQSAQSHACIVFGALHSIGTAREAAFKLEENSWTAIGKAMDYRDFAYYDFVRDPNQNLVIVNATCESRLNEALSLMKKLYISDIPFTVVTYENPAQSEMAFYSQGRYLLLPKVEDPVQPFVDLIFYYIFAFRYAKAHGRNADDFPRNRAKSVTVSRSRSKKKEMPVAALNRLKLETPSLAKDVGDRPLIVAGNAETAWEREAAYEWEKNYYRRMRRLAGVLCEEDPLKLLLKVSPEHPERLAKAIFEELAEDGEIIFLPFDRASDAAVQNVVHQWSRFLPCSMRVAAVGESLAHFSEDSLLMLVSSNIPHLETLGKQTGDARASLLWMGPSLSSDLAAVFKDSLGYFALKEGLTFIECDFLYAAISLLLVSIWKLDNGEKAEILENHFRLTRSVVETILEHASLRETVSEVMAENQAYRTAFFLGLAGTGLSWTETFDRTGAMAAQWHPFGESPHGPLVTVDGRVETKFVRIRERACMVSEYGDTRVTAWEERYMKGESVDNFLKRSHESLSQAPCPFFAEENWYLPVLQEGYDAIQDNLIIMDAARSRHFAHTLDELSVYGCRYARIIVISQEAFQRAGALRHYPISHLLLLPSLPGNLPIPEFLLPFAMNLLATGMAAAAARVRGSDSGLATEESAFERAFGHIGAVMIRQRVDIHYMSHYLIEALKGLSPMITAVQGVIRYAVRMIEKEEELLGMARQNLICTPEETLENFRIHAPSGAASYLLRPEWEMAEGKARTFADHQDREDAGALWSEPYGNVWKTLTHRVIGVQETPEGDLLLLLPLIDRTRKRGWLCCFHVCFAEWDHAVSLEEDKEVTVKALGRDMSSSHEYINSRYLKLASRFNDEMMSLPHTWDDRLLGLVKRPLLFCKPSRDIAALLAWRFLSLSASESEPMETVLGRLEKIWGTFHESEAQSDEERWDILCGRM